MLSFIWRCCLGRCLQLNQPPPLNHSVLPTAGASSQLSDSDPAPQPHFNNTPLSPSITQSSLTLDKVNYSISLTSRSHQGQLYQPDYSSQPELYGVENAAPLAASLGTEKASAVWSRSHAQANLACVGLWRISLMKYIFDLLQTCIVLRCCVLRWLPPDDFLTRQSETTVQIVWALCTRNAKVFSVLLEFTAQTIDNLSKQVQSAGLRYDSVCI